MLLNGKSTGRYGIHELKAPDGTRVEVTGLERTLIDILVRPIYAGGLAAIIEAYRRAHEQVSIKAIVETLGALGYVYPYHQAVGFLLQHAGCSAKSLRPLRELGMKYKFYVCHELSDPAYSSDWGVYHPRQM